MEDVDRLAFVSAELRFELGLLHDRVNALLTAEAFLTIAYTAAMSNGASWGTSFAAVVGPVLALLGLLLALLAWPGVTTTARIVLDWTQDQAELLAAMAQQPRQAGAFVEPRRGVGLLQSYQRRSLLFFRAVPAVFAVVWIALTVVALVLTR